MTGAVGTEWRQGRQGGDEPAPHVRGLNGGPAAAIRGRPARVSDLLRCDADCRVHHPHVGDRPAPHPPPRPRGILAGPLTHPDGNSDPGSASKGHADLRGGVGAGVWTGVQSCQALRQRPVRSEVAHRDPGEAAQGFCEGDAIREAEVPCDTVEARDPVIEQSSRDEEAERAQESPWRGPASLDKAAVEGAPRESEAPRRGLTVERRVRHSHGVRHELWWQNCVQPHAQISTDHGTGVQQCTVGLGLGDARRHLNVGEGRGISATHHRIILNVNGKQHGR